MNDAISTVESKRATRPGRTRGLGSGWLISAALHGALLFAASLFVRQAVVVVVEPEVSMALDLRATNYLPRAEERVRETTSASRHVIPDAPVNTLVESELAPRDLEAEFAENEYELMPSDVIASNGGAASVGGAVSVQRLPKRAAPLAGDAGGSAGPAPSAGGIASGDGASAYLPPELAASPAIEYPARSRRAAEEGDVRCRLHVSALGRVDAVEIALSSGFSRLDEAARLGLAEWMFKPATRDGAPCACVVEHVVTFRLAAAAARER